MTSILFKKKKNYQVPTTLQLFIVMGVSGSGKTAVGKELSKNLNRQSNFVFIDADDFHSPKAKQRMANNLPLDDEMRKPWVTSIMNKLVELFNENKNVVLAFSGLKQQHRERFRTLPYQCHFYYLKADTNIIRARMLMRKEHFFTVELLASQFLAMQEVDIDEQDITEIDASNTFDEVYKQVFTLAGSELKKEFL